MNVPNQWWEGRDVAEYLSLGFDPTSPALLMITTQEQLEAIEQVRRLDTFPGRPWFGEAPTSPRWGFDAIVQRVRRFLDSRILNQILLSDLTTGPARVNAVRTLAACAAGARTENTRLPRTGAQWLAWSLAGASYGRWLLEALPGPALRRVMDGKGSRLVPEVSAALVQAATLLAPGMDPCRADRDANGRLVLMLGPAVVNAPPEPGANLTGVLDATEVLIALCGLARLCDMARS